MVRFFIGRFFNYVQMGKKGKKISLNDGVRFILGVNVLLISYNEGFLFQSEAQVY